MDEELDQEVINKRRDLDNYYVAVVKEYESQGGNFLYADSPESLEAYRLSLGQDMELIPMKEALEEALEEGYPIQCLNNYDYLDELAYEYVESIELKNRINKSLGVFHFHDEKVLLMGSAIDNQLSFWFVNSDGDGGFIITENSETVLGDQIALGKENKDEVEFLINQGYIPDIPCKEYTNKWEKDILVFQLSIKGLDVKQNIEDKQMEAQKQSKKKQSQKELEMEN
ncbi:hypothetical protein D3Z35_08340 [Enterococcus faecalis]|uniref:hypothetical protein n=1 Tax=Enterococcus faecalis TaxID=1351 RepID=UPI00080C5021|nr:hypothetical protein [Enterococcus faecalis]ANU72512.1 hypothetical protein A4V06_05440 [Enterococcus faecalis]ASU27219.1 hypothetical protein ADH73_14895 [Enterococcus faecalis]MCO8258605.1 hypothetical protein [Enterococcus faecalis]MCP8906667.1 hypothetical protein [Enterococcus faecalis]MCP8909654.1 hypothetical protein [Enterococcus faecalis]